MTNYQRALRLSIYFGNADVHHHKALSVEILQRAHRAGLRGATTLHGVAGFGASTNIHTTPTWTLVDRTPVTVHIVDDEERIRAFLPQLDDIRDRCLVVCDDVEVPAS